ncbi:MAG: AmmeMemoRadiSam system protein A [Betaproteobacteria bacterium]
MTSIDDRRLLLAIARDAIAAHVRRSAMTPPALTGAAAQPGGAFVSLHLGDDLRGCIGHIEPDDLVGYIVARCAVAAASTDPRFPPVEEPELVGLAIELSLLGPLEPIEGPDEITIGRHGLLVERGWRRGLLLPQVATEWDWTAEVFLTHTCRKAGLPQDAWRSGARLWRFEAEVFGEAAQGGAGRQGR